MQPLGCRSFPEVLAFSVDQPEAFWRAVWDFCGVKAETRGERVLIDGGQDAGREILPRCAAELCREPAAEK